MELIHTSEPAAPQAKNVTLQIRPTPATEQQFRVDAEQYEGNAEIATLKLSVTVNDLPPNAREAWPALREYLRLKVAWQGDREAAIARGLADYRAAVANDATRVTEQMNAVKTKRTELPLAWDAWQDELLAWFTGLGDLDPADGCVRLPASLVAAHNALLDRSKPNLSEPSLRGSTFDQYHECLRDEYGKLFVDVPRLSGEPPVSALFEGRFRSKAPYQRSEYLKPVRQHVLEVGAAAERRAAAEKAAAAEAEKAAELAWVTEHGSERLKLGYELGQVMHGLYRKERSAHMVSQLLSRLPEAFQVVGYPTMACLDTALKASPSESAMHLLKVVRDDIANAKAGRPALLGQEASAEIVFTRDHDSGWFDDDGGECSAECVEIENPLPGVGWLSILVDYCD